MTDTIVLIAASLSLVLAAVPLALYLTNLRSYRPPPPVPDLDCSRPRVSVLIPARDEERSIAAAVESVLTSEGVDLELAVLDDHSRDDTRVIVERIAARDRRLTVHSAPPLPPGWCGKQHACWTLASLTRHDILVFLDADVRMAPEGIARVARFLASGDVGLASGVPAQETGTFLERLLLPLIHFILLGFLPVGRMRRSTHPAYAAGCGQLFVARRSAYERAGGHAAIRSSLHDGIALPAAFRRAGIATDLFDATSIARCRMYASAGEVWAGLSKNATEGLAHPKRIVPVTLLLLGGQVLPPALLAGAGIGQGGLVATLLAAAGCVAAFLPRLDACFRFSQPLGGALLHPLGIVVFLAIQWLALARRLCGRPAAWKGRTYPGGGASGDGVDGSRGPIRDDVPVRRVRVGPSAKRSVRSAPG